MNKKLVLYSDQTLAENRMIGYRLLELLGKTNPRLGYIPSSYDPERFYFAQTNHYYATLGVSLQDYFEYDTRLNSETTLNLFGCDAVHLSGGNTFQFLPHFEPSTNMTVEVSKLSSKHVRIVYTCPDGCGIVVDGSDVEVFGDVETFELS